jgi:hypothetical protein
MAEHKFRAGQRVRLTPNRRSRHAGGRGYIVTRQLPSNTEENLSIESRVCPNLTNELRVRAILLANSHPAT